MKFIFLYVLTILQLLASDATVFSKKIEMGDNHFAYIDYDKEWDTEGTLQFSKNLQCYIVSSGNINCMDGNYTQNIDSLKNIIFADVDKMIATQKPLSWNRINSYKEIYEGFGFKNTPYEGLFGYLFIVYNHYEHTNKITITQNMKTLLLIKDLLLSSKQQVSAYNNMAYFLQLYGANKEAIYLLEKILQKYPNRTVAYYNIGDAYWAVGDKEKAKQAYRTYIKQMKAKGKEKRIPKIVLQRAKE